MHNTCVSSTITLRTRGALPFSLNDYSYCSNERYPFTYLSSRNCCSCCANSVGTVPINPSYCYGPYGFRQSSLIQWLPCRKVSLGGFDRSYYSRLPVCFVDRSCHCDKVYNFSNKNVGRGRGGLRKCMVFEEKSERFDLGSVDEAEVLLSLLSEDVGEEYFNVRKETKKFVRKPAVEKREECEFCSECGNKKKNVDLGPSESKARFEYESVVSWRKDDRSREERNRKEEEREAMLLKRKNRKARLVEVKTDALSRKEVSAAENIDRGGSSRNESKRYEGQQKIESSIRKENWTAGNEVEEDEEFFRREEHRRRVRKDGSSCSSYYSLSSNGDYESDYEIEVGEGRFSGDSSNVYKRNSRSYEEEDKRHEDSKADHVVSLMRKTSGQESRSVGSAIVECDFRKKSEKKLTDVSIEESESKKGNVVQKESKTSMVQESGDVKHDSCKKYDDRKVKSTESSKLDVERKHLRSQIADDVSRQSERRMKHKQFVPSVDIPRTSDGSSKVYSGTDEMSVQATSSRQEAVDEKQTAVRHSATENVYQSDIRQVAETTGSQDIDIRNTSSSSQQKFETRLKVEEEYTKNILNFTEKHHYDQANQLEEFRGKSHQLTQNKSTSTSKKQSESELIRQEESLNLAYVSSSGSKEQSSQTHAKFIQREDFRSGSNRLTSGSVVESGHDMRKPETLIGPPSQTGGTGPLRVESTGGIVVEEVVGERLQSDSAALHGHHLERTTALHHEEHEGAIESAAESHKSAARYVGEFVDKVGQEITRSQIKKEKRTSETELEQHNRESIVQSSSGVSLSEEKKLKRAIGTKGPSDEMWKVDGPSSSVQEQVVEDANRDGNAVVKRTGRSLWNVIGDIVRLRWSSRSESQSTSGKTGGRSSTNQSTSSETWFSGHEAEENEETPGQREKKNREQESHFQREEVRSQIDDGSDSSTLHVGTSGLPPPTINISLPSTEEGTSASNSGDASSSAPVVESSVSLPALRLRRSPVIRSVTEGGEENISESGGQPNTSMKQSEVNEAELTRKKLQRKDQVLRDRFDEWEDAYRLEAEQRKIDEMFMREALLEARKAADNWEVPVGAVLIHDGKIIARGCNLVEELRDSTAHAEMICIREASNILRTWRLSGTTLYVTLEPCPMCAGAILQARVDTVVWGAPNKLLGADGSWIRLFPNGDGGNGFEQATDKPADPVHPFHPKIVIRRGVLASECADAMQQFFQLRRKKKEKKPESPSQPSCLPISHHPSKLITKMHDAFSIMFCL